MNSVISPCAKVELTVSYSRVRGGLQVKDCRALGRKSVKISLHFFSRPGRTGINILVQPRSQNERILDVIEVDLPI